MSLVLNTNIASLNASRNLANTQNQQATTFERLSTGLRVNSAKDDAAGLYLAQMQTKDIRGLSMATRNANDGISMAQTAEGAMDQIQQNLQRINELSIQAANGTYNNAAREGLQKEVDQLTQEINRIVETTEFNGEKLLSRDATALTMQIGFRNDEGSRIDTGLKGGLVAADKNGKFAIPGSTHTFDNERQAQLAGEFAAFKNLLGEKINPHNILDGSVEDASIQLATPTLALDDADNIATLKDGLGNEIKSAADVTNNFDAVSGLPLSALYGGLIDTAATPPAITSHTDTSRAIYDGLAQLGHPGDSFEVDGMTFTRQVGAQADSYGSQLQIEFNGKTTTIDNVWNEGSGNLQAHRAFLTDGNVEDLFGSPANSLQNDLYPTAAEFFGNGIGAISYIEAENTAGEGMGVLAISDLAVYQSGELAGLGMGETIEQDGWTFTRANNAGDFHHPSGNGDGQGLVVSYGNRSITLDNVFAVRDNGNYGTGLAPTVVAEDTTQDGSDDDHFGTGIGRVFTTANMETLLEGNREIVDEVGNLSTLLNGDLEGTKVIDISTQEAAQKAIDFTRDAIDIISEIRATFGANMNRFEAVISGNQIYSENLTAARSRIQDADFATETSNLAKQQVLQQAGIASLSQANASSQAILSLLG